MFRAISRPIGKRVRLVQTVVAAWSSGLIGVTARCFLARIVRRSVIFRLSRRWVDTVARVEFLRDFRGVRRFSIMTHWRSPSATHLPVSMFSRSLVFLGALVAISSVAVQAEESLTPEGAVAIALEQNRDLAAARLAIQEAEARLQQSGLRPNPELEVSQSNDLLFANEGEYNFSLGFKQRFPLTGRLAKAKAVARVDVTMAAAEVQNQERLLAGDVLGQARDLLITQQKIAEYKAIQAQIQKLIAVSENRLRAAEVSQADVNTAKLSLQQASLAQAELVNEAESIIATLNAAMGRDPATPLTMEGSVDPTLRETDSTGAVSEALTKRPDRQLAVLAIDRADAEIKLAKAEKWEDVAVGVDYGRDYGRFTAPIGGKLDNFFGVSVSVPLPLWNKNQGRISEAQARQRRAAAALGAVDLRIATEIKAAKSQMNRLAAILDRYRHDSFRLADDNLALVQQGYANGLVNITAVIQAQQQYIEQRLGYLDTLAKYGRALTEWQTATTAVPLNPIEK